MLIDPILVQYKPIPFFANESLMRQYCHNRTSSQHRAFIFTVYDIN